MTAKLALIEIVRNYKVIQTKETEVHMCSYVVEGVGSIAVMDY